MIILMSPSNSQRTISTNILSQGCHLQKRNWAQLRKKILAWVMVSSSMVNQLLETGWVKPSTSLDQIKLGSLRMILKKFNKPLTRKQYLLICHIWSNPNNWRLRRLAQQCSSKTRSSRNNLSTPWTFQGTAIHWCTPTTTLSKEFNIIWGKIKRLRWYFKP